MGIPPLLHRYCKVCDYTARVFTHDELYFASPTAFNDPFDCAFRIWCEAASDGDLLSQIASMTAYKAARLQHPAWTDEQCMEAAERVGGKIGKEYSEEALRQLSKSFSREYNDKAGILCLTKSPDEILMWSHYADLHRGVCLEFRSDVPNSIFSKAQLVIYRDSLPHLALSKLVRDPEYRNATEWILTKWSSWSYETEWRILDFEHGPGVRTFQPECLTAVTLGCRVTEQSRAQVLDWVQHHPTKIEVRQANRSSAAFRLDISPVT